MRIARHVKPGELWTDVGARHEIEVLAILVEGCRTRITQTVSHLPALRFLQRINEDRAVPRLDRFGVSDPAAIRRPTRIEAEAALGSVNLDRRTFIQIHIPEVEPLVREGNLFAVG